MLSSSFVISMSEVWILKTVPFWHMLGSVVLGRVVLCDMWMSFVISNRVPAREPGLLELSCAALLQVSFHGQLVS